MFGKDDFGVNINSIYISSNYTQVLDCQDIRFKKGSIAKKSKEFHPITNTNLLFLVVQYSLNILLMFLYISALGIRIF